MSCNPETLARDVRYIEENGVSGGGGLSCWICFGDGTYGRNIVLLQKSVK